MSVPLEIPKTKILKIDYNPKGKSHGKGYISAKDRRRESKNENVKFTN